MKYMRVISLGCCWARHMLGLVVHHSSISCPFIVQDEVSDKIKFSFKEEITDEL